ncbi:MspA family porin [Nocardia sp. CA-151230]|uniref:MspA family porin n=1 Tax=Nocardia sp. CA-151230 TaxID=3239982 RepID=UPI003D90DBF8
MAFGLLPTGAANADTFMPLPGGSIAETINLSGCGGHARARSFVAVQVAADSVIAAYMLSGRPFGLG